jgi:nitrogenase molybdenum-iron protein beta chain
MKTFLNVLKKHFDVDFSYEIEKMESEVTSGIKKVFSYLQKFYGIPVQLHGSIMKREGMKMFLEEELGLDCITFDMYAEIAMVFGSSFERRFTDEFKVPLVQYEYPVFDKVSLGLRSHIGGEGTLNLLEDILNAVMSGPKNRGAVYREKNMCIW